MPNFLNHIKTKFFTTETRKRLAEVNKTNLRIYLGVR